jgi:hypothetical protein
MVERLLCWRLKLAERLVRGSGLVAFDRTTWEYHASDRYEHVLRRKHV